MLKSGAPAPFPIPFANNAGAAYIRPIPQASQIGNTNGAASLTDGFPPLNFLAVDSGGIPPFGQDMNGLLFAVTASLQFFQAGWVPFYSAAFSAAIGGYPAGATLLAGTGAFFWTSTVDNNTSDPDTGGANWTAYYPFNPAILSGYATLAQLAAASAAAAAATAATPAGFRHMAVLGSTQNWTVPPGVTGGKVTVVGGGGGANGCNDAAIGSAVYFAGACGGGGGWTISYVTLTPGQSILATIGAGGAGVAAAAGAGNGGTSSFGSFGTAGGGIGGGGGPGAPAADWLAGGAPGSGSGGTINGIGDSGSDGCVVLAGDYPVNNWAGKSGGSLFGGSNRCGTGGSIPGLVYGAGGASPYGGTLSGSPGAPGVVIVEY